MVLCSDLQIDDLVAEHERVFPDPVDVFEDELAARIGFYKHPNCPRRTWRQYRVVAIEAEYPGE